MIVLTIVFAVSAILLILARHLKTKKELEGKLQSKESELKLTQTELERFKPITDIEATVASRHQEVASIEQQIGALKLEYSEKRTLYDTLSNEVSILEESLDNISYGLYKPHYTFATSEEYKRKLDETYEQQKALIKEEKATFCPVKWTVGNSAKDGERMTKQNSKVMLRAFNGECDAAVARVSWNNIGNMEARIQKAYEAINKLGTTNQISITEPYLQAKLDELHVAYELQQKLQQEKDEQRRIREQMREEEKAQQEIEKAQREASDEETRNQKALDAARKEMEKASGEKLAELNAKMQQLEQNLKEAQAKKERAISRAQLTKSGHLYVVSNIGSFGENVYKIGMTRRLDPMDRIDELGNASVPFDFDVHAIVYTENVPELEHKFHERLSELRVNLLNVRREFFNIAIEDVEAVAKELGVQMELTKLAEAKEYRATQSMREAKKNQSQNISVASERFPAILA
jgi:hypothetical protein